MPPLWSLSPGHDLALRTWGEECVVHHRLSNDTHRLAAWVGELLQDLAEQGPQTSAALAARFEGLDPAELELTLDQLRRLDLLTCSD